MKFICFCVSLVMLFIPLNLFGSSSFDPLGSENYFSQEAQWARLAGPDFLSEGAQWSKMGKTDPFNSRSKWAGEDVGPIDFEQPSIDEMARALPKKPKSTFKMPAFKTKKEFEDTLISVFRTNARDNRNTGNRRRGARRTPAAATATATATERVPIGLEIQYPAPVEQDQLTTQVNLDLGTGTVSSTHETSNKPHTNSDSNINGNQGTGSYESQKNRIPIGPILVGGAVIVGIYFLAKAYINRSSKAVDDKYEDIFSDE